MTISKLPLSPHLQVYRLPLVALVSISHRACGVINGLGYAIFIIFLISFKVKACGFLQVVLID